MFGGLIFGLPFGPFGGSPVIPAIVLPPPNLGVPQTVRSWLVLSDTSGRQVALFDTWKSLDIKHELNMYSTHTLVLDGFDARSSLFGTDYILQLWRQVDDFRYIEYEGFHRSDTIQLSATKESLFVSQGRGFLDLVHRRFILYPEGTFYTLKSGPGESVIKQIVMENVGPGANSLLRYRNGVTPGFDIDEDLHEGFSWTDTLSVESVLDAIRKIAATTQVDFGVVRTGPVNFLFVVRAPQWGTDRRAYLTFAPEFGNITNVVHSMDATNAVNAVTVLGPGQGGSRLVQSFLGDTTSDSPWNVLEGTTSPHTLPGALGAFLYEAMQYAASEKLTAGKPLIKFDFEPVLTDANAYGRDYAVGDIVTGHIGQHTHTLKIVGANLSIAAGRETLKLSIQNLVDPVIAPVLPAPPPPV